MFALNYRYQEGTLWAYHPWHNFSEARVLLDRHYNVRFRLIWVEE